MASMALQLKVIAIGQLIKSITGELPIVAYGPSYADISFSESQKIVLRQWVKDQLDASLTSKPGDIRIDFNSIIIPVAVEKLAPFGVGAGLIGFLLGRLL